jgi:hypothetical protein
VVVPKSATGGSMTAGGAPAVVNEETCEVVEARPKYGSSRRLAFNNTW